MHHTFSLKQIDELFADNSRFAHLAAYLRLIDDTYKKTKALTLEITDINNHNGSRRYKDRIMRSLFIEIRQQYLISRNSLNSQFTDLLTYFQDESIETLKSAYKNLQQIQPRLFLTEYLLNAFYDQFELAYCSKHDSEPKNIFKEQIGSNQLTRLLNRFDIRIGNALKNFKSSINELIQNIANTELENLVFRILTWQHYSDRVFRTKEICEPFADKYPALLPLINKMFAAENNNSARDLAFYPFFREFDLNSNEESKIPLYIMNDNTASIFARYYFNLAQKNLLMLMEESEIFGSVLAIFLRKTVHQNILDFYPYPSIVKNKHTEDYIEEVKRCFPSQLSLRENKLLIIDLETTGTNPFTDLIIEIGLVEIDLITLKITPLINMTVKQFGFDIACQEAQIFQMSSLTWNMIEESINVDYILPYLQRIISTTPISSFNTRFDLAFLRHALQIEIPYSHNCVMETAQYVLKIPHEYYGVKYPSLKETYEYYFKTAFVNQHRAYADALACAQIVVEMIKRGEYTKYNSKLMEKVELEIKKLS